MNVKNRWLCCLCCLYCHGCLILTLYPVEDARSVPGPETPVAPTAHTTTFASGPLRVSKSNPRYFEDAQGQIVYLTGSGDFLSLIDTGYADPPAPFDFAAYLAFLQRHNHNFIRMWTRDNVVDTESGFPAYAAPLPWARTGPGQALDGKPRFDLTKYDPEYFQRMHARVALAGQQGIYVSIMLFEGWTQRFATKPGRWDGNPFNRHNNLNGIDGDPANTGAGTRIHTLDIPAITRLQEAYVRQVVDTVNDLDNVLYEISNEDGPYSKDWQYHLIRYLHTYEKTKPKQHPVGMTFAEIGSEEETNRALFESPAEWISPLGNDPASPWKVDPPPGDGRKVVLVDTDHLWGGSGPVASIVEWVWKTFCRGHNVVFYDHTVLPGDGTARAYAGFEPIRNSLGYTRHYALRMDLAAAVPCSDLSSTGYCLSDKKRHFLVFKPAFRSGEGQQPARPITSVMVNLTDAPGLFNVEWLNPATGVLLPSGQLRGGERHVLLSPIPEAAVLFLWKPTPFR